MYLKFLKHVPAEGLKAGDIVKFMDETAAKAFVAAEHAVEVVRKVVVDEATKVSSFVEHTFVDPISGDEHVHDPAAINAAAAEAAAAAQTKE
jgi:hypothetical protein